MPSIQKETAVAAGGVNDNLFSGIAFECVTRLRPDVPAFREAVLVQYPRADSWTIAFITGAPSGEVARHLQGEHVSIYVPTTPNPTSGFFLMMPRDQVVPLAMSVDEALKYIISMGVVAPVSKTLPADTPKQLS